MSEDDLFFSQVSYSDECWEWIGPKGSRGYGLFAVGGKLHRAHRWSYEYFFGQMSPGAYCCHHCDNPKCVNPFHLFEGTPLDNIVDMVEKKRHQNAKKTHCKYGHPYSGDNLIVSYRRSSGRTYRGCRICRYNSSDKYWQKKKKSAAIEKELEGVK